MSDETYISDEMRAVVGRPFNRARSYPVSASDIRKWAIAVHFPELPPPLYWGEEASMVAPEDFNPFAWASAEPGMQARRADFDADYVETVLGIRGPGLKTNLNSGLDTVYGVRMRPGDVVSTVSHVREYLEKEGRMGRMLLTILRTEWTNDRGETVKRTDQTSIRY